jgi:hypothetical protein
MTHIISVTTSEIQDSDFVFDPDNANRKPTLTLMPLSENRLWNELCKRTCMKGSTEGYLPV